MEEFEKEDILVEVKEERYPLGEVSILRWVIALIILNCSFFIMEIFPEKTWLAVMFLVGPIVSLFVLGHKSFRRLFKGPKLRDIPVVFGMTVLTILVGVISSIILERFGSVDNPIVGIANEDNIKYIAILLMVQLVIEEIFFIIWFLFLYHKAKFEKESTREIFAWVVSSLIFGAMHLSTYNFNIVQAVIGIGIVRFVLSAVYIRRKNLTLAYIVHFLYDILIILAVVTSANMQ
ncbi:CPBP family intramembrane glutamic endopeptidase [Peptoniphilus indolicus]|uniref:CAAX amino protease n=2 Tax=Peptoniphilus indolicus TaxID=33030 RepID=G4D640_9FIRM|nr:CPBP family intramembrane glutamic endopeptidase [Peptoniphilus indolicus]EGY77440.1 CAAX amino protease [Peptoniphilus indolicus ATCC 29427]SUB74530.1 CAAX amino terminal protease self- immunity [Peptoniphilus indolicus]